MSISVFHFLPQDFRPINPPLGSQPSAGQSGCPKAVQPRMKLMGHSHNFLLPVNSCGVWSPPAPRRQSHSAHGLHWPPFPSSHALCPTLLLGGWGSPQKEQVLPQLRLCSREPQTVVHATPPNRKAGAITHRNDDVTHTRAHPPTFSIFTCPLMIATQVGCADVKKQARKRTILERVPAHIHTTGRCPDVGVMRSKPPYLAFLGKRGAVCFLGALKWLLGEWGL